MTTLVSHGRFLIYPALQIIAIWGFFTGGIYMWAGLAAFAAVTILLDDIAGDHLGASEIDDAGGYFNALLYLALPLHVLMVCALLAHVCAPSGPYAQLLGAFGIDVPVLQARTGLAGLFGGVYMLGIHSSSCAGDIGHELIHRKHSAWQRFKGRVLLAFCWDTTFAIDHIHGHHRTVGTPDDPTTAPRGLSYWRYLPRTITGAARNAFAFEAQRLARRGEHWASLRNQALTGQLMSLAIALVCYLIAGLTGLLVFFASAMIGKAILELFNYIGHYGLVRVPGKRVAARHAWNSYRLLSTSFMFNLPRHASHHLATSTPYWQLARERAAPAYPHGPIITSLIAMVPPLWFRFTAPLLERWDEELAIPEERALIASASARPGI